jgi:adenylate kinase family enzyme
MSQDTARVLSESAPMRRVMVIGCGGAGKSTFAARLARVAGLPLVHLDSVYWHPGWVRTPPDEWAETVRRLAARECWVIDGNYSGTMDIRAAAADTVIFLDVPRRVCLWRALKRRVQHHGHTRPDMTDGCVERIDAEFVRWIWSYPKTRRPRILARLAALGPGKRAVILRSSHDIERFFRSIEPAPG